MIKIGLMIVLSSFLITEVTAQQIGERVEVEAVKVDIDANWRPLFFNSDLNQISDYEKRFDQQKYSYTPPEGWVIISYRLANEYSRGGNMEVVFEEGGEVRISEEVLSSTYQNLIEYSEEIGDHDLKERIKTDYEYHKDLIELLSTNYNQMLVFAEVESYGATPSTRTMASRNKGVMQADVIVTIAYLGRPDVLLSSLVQKYELKADATRSN